METIYWLPQYALPKHPANPSTARTKLGSTHLLVILVLPFLCGWIKLWGDQDSEPFVLMGHGHHWLRWVGWCRVVWAPCPSSPPPGTVLPVEDAAMLEAGGKSPWPGPAVHTEQEVLQSAAQRSWGRTSLHITHFRHYPCLSSRVGRCQPTGSPTLKG